MPRQFRFILLLSGLLLGAAAGLANELWLLPAGFVVAPGTRQTIRVLVGHNFAGTRWPGNGRRLASFMHFSPHDTVDLTKAAGQADTLNTTVVFGPPGVHMLAFTTTNSFVELAAGQFNEYLQQEGLDQPLEVRRLRQELDQPGREAYRRCAKTLIQVAPGRPDTARTYARRTGQPLELVPEQNPYALPDGSSLTVRVLADGLPLRGMLVQVWQHAPGQPTRLFKLRSNQNGRVLFKLSSGASYLVSTVRMVAAADPKTADWQSTWATLTFGTVGISGR